MARENKCKKRVQDFFEKVRKFTQRVFKGVEDFINKNIEPAINFVTGLKKAVDSEALDVVVGIIPGTWDDKLLAAFRTYLGKAIEILEIQLTCGQEASLEDKIACYIQHLRTCSPEVRNALYSKTASLLTKLHAGDEAKQYTNAEIDALVQFEYTKIKNQ